MKIITSLAYLLFYSFLPRLTIGFGVKEVQKYNTTLLNESPHEVRSEIAPSSHLQAIPIPHDFETHRFNMPVLCIDTAFFTKLWQS